MYKIIFTLKNEEKYLFAEYIELISFFEESEKFLQLIKNNNEIRNKIIQIFIDFNKTYHLENKIIYIIPLIIFVPQEITNSIAKSILNKKKIVKKKCTIS